MSNEEKTIGLLIIVTEKFGAKVAYDAFVEGVLQMDDPRSDGVLRPRPGCGASPWNSLLAVIADNAGSLAARHGGPSE